MMKKFIFYFILLILIAAALFTAGWLFFFQWIVNWLWLVNTGFSGVFTGAAVLEAMAFIVPMIVSLFITGGWFYILRRLKKNSLLNFMIIALCLSCAFYGLANWKMLLIDPFEAMRGYSDPFFHLNAYFYIGILPLLRQLLFIFNIIITFTLVFDIILSGNRQSAAGSKIRFKFGTAFIFSLCMVLWVLFYLLCVMEILVSQPEMKIGVGFSEFYALALGAVIWSALVILVLFFLILRSLKGLRIAEVFASAILIGLLYFGLTGLFPLIMENYFVKPNELMLQRPFVKYRIDATRTSFGLVFTTVYYPVLDNSIKSLSTSLDSLRIWDSDPYKKVVDQVQSIKTYFDFADVDVDSYMVPAAPSETNLVQVLIAARELNISNLPPEALNWDNIHLRYTHGHGVVVSPAHIIDKDGSPVFWVGGIDRPAKYPIFDLVFPQIYFGELTSRYIIINTKADEFEYTTETNRITNRYSLERGVPVGNIFSKLLFSIVLREKNILLSSYITKDSRIMFHNNIIERIKTAFPYLKYDSDPYPVILKGRLVWIIDAYTVSDRFPLAEKFDTPFGRINYIRNSVKVTVDAYSGDINFYLVDDNDPIAMSYKKIFPLVFQSEIPAGLEAHFRYPHSLFRLQSEVMCRYHTDNEDSFYNGDNVWDIPKHIYGEHVTNFEPYYMLSSFKTDDFKTNYDMHFSIIEPFTPRGRENISGWMMAYYSRGMNLALYYPEETGSVYGPMQIETKINQDDRMSSFFTLWSQKGSKVFRGNIKFIPIGKDILYVEPIFLESEQIGMPQLVKLAAVYRGTVFIGNNYEDLIASIALSAGRGK
jgi:uncharacterized membrane protein (UPF0182 family)